MVHIDSTKSGEISIDSKTYYNDVVIWWDGKIEPRMKEHVFSLQEFLSLVRKRPESIIVGTGQSGSVKIADDVKETADEMKIVIYSDTTPKAMEIFNAFVKEGKKTAAVMHLNE